MRVCYCRRSNCSNRLVCGGGWGLLPEQFLFRLDCKFVSNYLYSYIVDIHHAWKNRNKYSIFHIAMAQVDLD